MFIVARRHASNLITFHRVLRNLAKVNGPSLIPQICVPNFSHVYEYPTVTPTVNGPMKDKPSTNKTAINGR